MNLSLDNTGGAPAAAQWTLSYSSSEVVSVAATASPAMAAAGKTLTCVPGAGTLMCVLYGANASTLPNGQVAVFQVSLSATTTASNVSLNISNVLGVMADGTSATLAATGGVISVTQPSNPSNPNSPGNPPTTSGLVAAYAFSEGSGTTVADVSGNGNVGTIENANWSSAGKYGSSLLFNGSSGWVTIKDSPSLDLTTGMTLEAWVNPTVLGSSWRTVLLKEQTNGMLYALYAQTDTNQPSGHVFLSAENNIRGTSAVPANTWTHLATTFDGAALRLYVNGTLVGNKAISGSIKTSGGVLRIGGNNIWPEFFNGLIDEVRIYNRPLTVSEIQRDMGTAIGGTSAPPTTPLVSGLQCSSTSVISGGTLSCTVTLSKAAPTGGVSVALSSNNGALTIPTTLTVGAGNTTGSFTARAGSPTTNQSVTLTASLNGSSVTSVVTVTSATPPPATGSDLVAAYTFNEGAGQTVADVSGNGNTGTIYNATWSSAGKYGKALSFNGTNSWVTVNDSATLDLTRGMTLEAWVNPTSLGSVWRTVILKEQPGAMSYALYAQTDTNRPSGHVYIASEFDTRGTGPLATNTWTHLATTYDGATLRLYVNGALASSKNISGNVKTSANVLRIGGNSIWNEYFAGLIDEIRIYNRALSATEIQTDMNTAVVVLPSVKKTVNVTSNRLLRGARQSAEQVIGKTSAGEVSSSQDAPVATSSAAQIMNVPGRQFAKFGQLLQFHVSLEGSSTDPVQLTAAGLPEGATFDSVTGRFDWTPTPAQTGTFVVTFSGTGPGLHPVSAQVAIDVDLGVPVVDSSQAVACSPGAIGTLEGKWLSESTHVVTDLSGTALSLAGTEVKVNQESVPLIQVSANRIQFLCPSLPDGTALSIAVTTAASSAIPLDATMQAASPEILSLARLSLVDGTDETAETSVRTGDEILLRSTGFAAPADTIQVEVGNVNAEVESMEQASDQAGVYLVRVRVPELPAAEAVVPVRIRVLSPDGRLFESKPLTVAR